MIYLDTSFLTPLFRTEETSDKVQAFLNNQPAGSLAISLWTRVEFASVVARDVRMRKLSTNIATELLNEFEALAESSLHILTPSGADFDLAQQFVAEFRSELRGPDALHLSIAKNHRLSEILSLDEGLLLACRRLKIKARRGIR